MTTRFQNPMHAADGNEELAALEAEAGLEDKESAAVKPGGGAPGSPVDERHEKKPGRCSACLFELCEYKIDGFRLPQFLALLRAVILPMADAATDWGVTINWFLDGDTGWGTAGLSIMLVSGTLSGLILGLTLDEMWKERNPGMGWEKAVPLGLLIGLSGLAPVAVAALALHDRDTEVGTLGLKYFTVLELIFESLPQSILQCVILPSLSALLLV